RMPNTAFRNVTNGQQDHGQANRDINQEDATPAPVGHEQAAEDGPDHGADGEDTAEQAHGAVTRVAKVIDDDAGRRGRETGTTGGLYGAQGDQHINVAGESTA